MNDWLIDSHQNVYDKYLDKIGGFPKTTPKISTSSYMESINDAYSIAKKISDQEHEAKYKDSIKKGIRYILQLQYTKENTYYFIEPELVIGGFKQSLTNNYIRNDFAQHSFFALMKTSQNKIFEIKQNKN
jgi:hypothetical protein